MAKSVINPDGTVNVSQLQREIREDLSLHRKHAAEDGMKKKAIHTSVDYDEFKNFVSVAELKPATSRDVSRLFTGGLASVSRSNAVCQDRNQGCGIGGYRESIRRRKDASVELKKLNDSDAITRSSNSKIFSAANNIPKQTGAKSINLTKKSSREAHDFLREWKRKCRSPDQTLSFLTEVKTSNDRATTEFVLPAAATCNEYFVADIDSEILGDIVEGLHLLTENEQGSSTCLYNVLSAGSTLAEFVNDWLKSLLGCGRFELSLSFLTSEQINKMKRVLQFVKRSEAESSNANTLVFIEQYESLLK